MYKNYKLHLKSIALIGRLWSFFLTNVLKKYVREFAFKIQINWMSPKYSKYCTNNMLNACYNSIIIHSLIKLFKTIIKKYLSTQLCVNLGFEHIS